ncbi:MAG: HNH endonuclease [Burkholderiales bacterium]|nr:HNH endonuclease [Burkholderiales bacterium]
MTDRGLCECGCGNRTRIAPVNDRSKGWVKGNHLRFIKGHNVVTESLKRSKSSIGNKGIHTNGYAVINVGGGKRKYEHICIAESVLGRKLKRFGIGNHKTEVVHHINGDKQDNRKENLLICTHEYHTALHHRLEESDNWPEFKKIIRNTGAKNKHKGVTK